MMRKHRSAYRALAEGLDGPVDATQCANESPAVRGLIQMAVTLTELWQQAVPTPPGQLRLGRSRFLALAASRSSEGTGKRALAGTGILSFARAAAAIAVLLALLAPLGRGIVRAARDSAPGHLLYPLKTHVERVQYAGAEQPDVRVALSLAFLGERVAEAQAVVSQRRALDGAFSAEVQQLTYQLLQAVAETSEASLPDVIEYSRLQLAAYLKVLFGLEQIAGAEAQAGLADVTQACRRAYLITVRALDHPAEFRAAYRIGRPELFLLPGERPLNGGSVMIDQASGLWETPL